MSFKKNLYKLFVALLIIQSSFIRLIFNRIIIIAFYAKEGKSIIIFDIIYFFVNFSFIYFAFRAFRSYLNCKEYPKFKCYNNLVLYKDIKIEEFELPKDFESIENKRKFIESKVNYFEIDYSKNDLNLIRDTKSRQIGHCKLGVV